MKIEDRRNEKKTFDSLKIGDVFRYNDNLYMRINSIYPIESNNDDIEEIEEYIEFSDPANAYNLGSHRYDTIGNNEEVLIVKATLVIE